jgi:enoyl-CoA hydratase/carnithine racemase
MYEEMTDSLKECSEDKTTKIVVITGTGEFFTAGNDIQSLIEAFQNKTAVFDMGFACVC